MRHITDVGHLEHDADEGEDKIAKKARLEQLEPMEVVQYYLLRYHNAMDKLNVLPPSIEPHASGHIIEQIEFEKRILAAGYAYESEGSVYTVAPDAEGGMALMRHISDGYDLTFTIEANVADNVKNEVGSQEVRVGKTHIVKTANMEFELGMIVTVREG